MNATMASDHILEKSSGSQPTLAEHIEAGCPMAPLLETLTRPWTMHILWNLSTHGPMRFGALKRAVQGISARLLTVRLRTLESEGFVRRIVLGGKVPEVTYAPTARLTDMDQMMRLLADLHAKWEREAQTVSARPA